MNDSWFSLKSCGRYGPVGPFRGSVDSVLPLREYSWTGGGEETRELGVCLLGAAGGTGLHRMLARRLALHGCPLLPDWSVRRSCTYMYIYI